MATGAVFGIPCRAGGMSTSGDPTVRSEANDGGRGLRPTSGQTCLIDGRGRILWVNEAWREFAARHGAARCGEGVDYLTVCGGADRQRFPEAVQVADSLRRLLAGALDYFELEYSCPTPELERRFVMRAQCLTIDGRRCAFVLHEDVTQARRAEQLIRDSEARYRQLFAAAPDAVFVVGVRDDEFGRILDANEVAMRQHGYSREELLRMSIGDLDVPADAERVRGRIEQLFRDGCVGFDVMHRRRDGSEFPVEVTARLAELGGRQVILSFNRDITERRRAEAELREQAVRLDLAARSSEVGFWDWDLATDRVFFSPEWKAQLGYAPHEIGDDFTEWRTRCHPDDVGPALDAVQSHLRGEIPYVSSEFRMRHRDGNYRWIYSRGRVVLDAVGKPLRLVGCHVDITANKRSEQERAALASRIERVQRLEAIGTLAGGIAHDFNNILTVIAANVDLALQAGSDTDLLAGALGDVRKAADRAKALVRQILAFSRNDPVERRAVVVADLLAQAQRLLRSTVPQALTIEVQKDGAVPDVLADAEQLQQVLLNLGTNAWHAIGNRNGRITLRARPMTVAGRQGFGAELPPGEHALLEVIDDGCGMDAATLGRIFEPFFTTKSGTEGTGLGLSVVHGIVKRHGGAIEVHSEPGRGSTFRVLLPAARATTTTAAADESPPGGADERVLLLDDEVALLRVMKRGLERMGMQVTTFAAPEQALLVLGEAPCNFDVVVTDYDMPGLQGLQVASRVRELRPALPVILCSGFLEPEVLEAATAAGVARVLNKPFVAGDLARVVREVLASRGA